MKRRERIKFNLKDKEIAQSELAKLYGKLGENSVKLDKDVKDESEKNRLKPA